MTTIAEIRAWLDTLGPESTVAIDDGGLTLVELDKGTEPTGAYLEVGGVPVFGDQPVIYDPWGEDPTWQRHEWEHEVGEHDTNLGYWEWVGKKKTEALIETGGH